MIQEYPQVLYSTDISDISISYICPENSMRAEPYWIIKTDEQDIFLRMQGKGD